MDDRGRRLPGRDEHSESWSLGPPSPDSVPRSAERPAGRPLGEEAKRQLLARHLGGLRAFVRTRIGRSLRARESSLDLAQSVCREALEDLDRFEYRGEASFRSWLQRRAEHKICDRARFWQRERRDAQREIELEAAAPRVHGGLLSLFTPSRDASGKEDLERLEEAFMRLSPDQREVIRLARFAGLVHEEVARRMGRTPSATRSLLSRALARLSTLLEESTPD